MTATYTPGPWHVNELLPDGTHVNFGRGPIAETDPRKVGQAQAQANALLIAAAPELLALAHRITKIEQAHWSEIATLAPQTWMAISLLFESAHEIIDRATAGGGQ